MYKILFVSALPNELKVVKESVKNLKIRDLKVDFLCSWMWNYETIFSLTKYLEKTIYDMIINIWVCWYIDEKQDFLQVSRIVNISTKKEALVPVYFKFWELVSIASSEVPIYNRDDILWEKYVDMESYGVELVCNKYNIPRIILKVPVDKIWIETKNFDINKALKSLKDNINYEELLKTIVEFLAYMNEKNDIHKYIKYFTFTHSETEIFRKLFNEYRVFSKNNFDIFFDKNKSDTKKDFLNKLREYNNNLKII